MIWAGFTAIGPGHPAVSEPSKYWSQMSCLLSYSWSMTETGLCHFVAVFDSILLHVTSTFQLLTAS